MSIDTKKEAIRRLAEVIKDYYPNIGDIEVRLYRKDTDFVAVEEEFVLLTWINGGYSTANNNCNSVSATIRNVARMLDGGVYENYEYYTDIMENKEWKRIA